MKPAHLGVCLALVAASGCSTALDLTPPGPSVADWTSRRPIQAAWKEGVAGVSDVVSPLPVGFRSGRVATTFELPSFSRIAFLPRLTPAGWQSSRAPSAVASRNFGPAERGVASWYAEGWAWRPAASGEIYNPYSFTAAHKTLPFDSVIQVTNLGNGRSMLVRINNRGPFKDGRIIDVSPAAAKALGFYEAGLANVEILRVQ